MGSKELKKSDQPKSRTTNSGKPAIKKNRSAASYLTQVKKETAAVKPDSEQRQSRVQEKAFDLYQRREGTNGLDQFDWALAETFVALEERMNKNSRLKSANKQISKNLEKEIEKKAYEIFERRGCIHGYNEFDWQVAKELVYIENNIPVNRG